MRPLTHSLQEPRHTPTMFNAKDDTATARPGLVKRLLVPEVVLLLAVGLSFAVWAIPGESPQLRGFSQRSSLTFESFAPVFLWYVALAGATALARRIGLATAERRHRGAPVVGAPQQRLAYWLLTVAALVGTTYALLQVGSLQGLAAALSANEGNLLNESLGGQSGLATLRYTTAIAAPFGFYLLAKRIVGWPSVLLNLSLLFATALFSSRLSLLLAVVVAAFLLTRETTRFRLRARLAVPAGSIIFIALVAFNYWRNANYYRALGIEDPISMNFYQVAAYLGAPAQASIGMADAMSRSLIDPSGSPLLLLVPSFLRASDDVVTGGPRYPAGVDVAGNLTTNSVFADVANIYGYSGLLIVFVVYIVLAFVFGRVQNRTDSLAILGGVILYCFAEVWRIYLVNQGIVSYLIVATLGAYLASRMLAPAKSDA